MNDEVPDSLNDEELRETLNLQTGKLDWKDLERFFARGVLVSVASDLDLVEVAVNVIKDNKQQIQAWLSANLLANASAENAREWERNDTRFWAVVAAPWVLVQEIASKA